MSKNERSTSNPLFAEMAQSSRILTNAVPRSVGLDSGTTWLVDGARATIAHQPSVHEVIVQYVETGKMATVAVSALKPLVLEPGSPEAAGSPRAITSYSAEDWRRAVEEERRVKAHLEADDLSPSARREVAAALKLSDRHLRRKIDRYRILRSVAAFLPDKGGAPKGSTQLEPALEAMMRKRITELLKTSPDIAINDLVPLVRVDAEAMGFSPPGRTTIARRLRVLRKEPDLLAPSVGKELKYRRRMVHGATAAPFPLQRTQLDHTIADVHIVEPNTGEPIGRPVLSLMLDESTRVVLGMALTLEAPSRLSVGLCIHHAVMPKDDWLRSIGVPDGCWPGYGLMREIYTDNAQEFHALSLQRACQVYSMSMAFRPPGHPAAGGIIERAIGTFMTKLRLLPGASYSKVLGKTPKGAHKSARLTLAELHQILAREVSRYHKTRHDGIGMPPLTAWEKGWNVNGKIAAPRVPESGEHFLLAFLPGEQRVVTREGVGLFNLQYQAMELAPLVEPEKKRMVRYDPRDLSRVYVEADAHHVVARLLGPPVPPFSLWEHREVRRAQLEAGRTRHIDQIAAEIEANRQVIEKATKRGGGRALRRQARQDEWAKTQAAHEPELKPKKDTPASGEPTCRVME